MSNPAIEWIKKHPAITAAAAGGVGLVVLLLSRSGSSTGSSSDVATIENAQLQAASLANQNAQVEAQANAQQNTAALSAQVQNNQVEAELAASALNTQAGVQTAQLAANVQENQTNQAAGVANNTVNAELAAQQSQVAAESQGLNTEFAYLTQANNNTTDLQKSILSTVSTGGNGGIFYGQSGTTDEALLSALSLATPAGAGTVPSAEGALGAGVVSNNAAQASIVNSIVGGLSQAFSGLFA